MRPLTPGQWYLLFVCQKCTVKQVLFQDLSEGKSKLGGVYHLPCRECGHEGTHDSDSIERYQHPVDLSQPTP
jgi:hypothetical protein